ncbi:MAG: MBL fold metallo-hydrolase [Proteobacteria bacterium]|nr:MBL fold metallo-hydrolase [Pseudomonadota bacterium]
MWWLLLWACGTSEPVATERAMPTPEALEAHCTEVIGEPRVEQVTERIWVAIGYDLANTILIATDAGNVIVDVGMHPDRAGAVHEALLAASPGPVHSIVYTHSHIDHVGGASTWAEDDTQIWATESFVEHFFKQYSTFLPAEQSRAARQFAWEVPLDQVPCSALGRRVDLEGTLRIGARMPTHTFEGSATLEIGGTTIELIEAHGETHDQLLVWLPDERVLLPGDNWYEAFPNLYTIRGSAPRPVDDWIDSLDRMRRLEPEIMVPSHTRPVVGTEAVQSALRDYRDAIQWIRDAVVRGGNEGKRVDQLVDSIGLPPHLASERPMTELYGQVDWSVRAIYGNELGWFDGAAKDLYPLPEAELAQKTIDAMGGPEAVLKAAQDARPEDPRWSVHLLSLLDADARLDKSVVHPELAASYEAVAATVFNTNGRGYLLRSAHERVAGIEALGKPELPEAFVEAIPLDLLFGNFVARLIPSEAMDVEESVQFRFPDVTYIVTVRRGVAELALDTPLPGTPEPLAVIVVDPDTWRRIALQQETALSAIADGRLVIEGSQLGFTQFIGRFERGLMRPPTELP